MLLHLREVQTFCARHITLLDKPLLVNPQSQETTLRTMSGGYLDIAILKYHMLRERNVLDVALAYGFVSCKPHVVLQASGWVLDVGILAPIPDYRMDVLARAWSDATQTHSSWTLETTQRWAAAAALLKG